MFENGVVLLFSVFAFLLILGLFLRAYTKKSAGKINAFVVISFVVLSGMYIITLYTHKRRLLGSVNGRRLLVLHENTIVYIKRLYDRADCKYLDSFSLLL